MGGDGERGKAWLRARGHHLCLTDTIFFFFFGGGGGGGGGAGELAFYFVGTLENNSLFLGNKTNERECLKIILRNKADHKKNLFCCCCIPSCPPIFPLPNTFYGTSWK